MKEHNVKAIYETLAKIFEQKEDCKISVMLKQNEKEKHTQNSQV